MEILKQLNLNETFFFQFVIFCIAYLVLTRLVFAPYSAALSKREEKTKGGEDLAAEIHKKASDLQTQYEAKARSVSGNVKTIFDDYRTEANREFETIVSKARAESQKLVEAARAKVGVEISSAQQQLKAEIPMVTQEMTRKLLAK